MSDVGFRLGFPTVADAIPAVSGVPLHPAQPGLVTGGSYLLGEEIDFTAVGVHQLLVPQPKKLLRGFVGAICLTVKDGTVTTGPTVKVGTNGTNDNCYASQVVTSFVAGVQGTVIFFASTPPQLVNLDLTATGLRLEITIGAVLGTATQLKARITNTFGIIIY